MTEETTMTDTAAQLGLATLSPIALTGEPSTDRGFLCAEDGRTYRVRVVSIPSATPTGNDRVAPFLEGVHISVVAMGADGRTMRNGHDQTIIAQSCRLTIDAETLAGEGGLPGALMVTVRKLVFRAIPIAEAEATIGAALAAWSSIGALPAPAPIEESEPTE